MSTSFIQAVLRYFPEAEVDLIVKDGFQNLPLPHRGEILPFNKKKISLLAFARQLRTRGYDRMYVLPPSFSSALMAYLSRIPQRIGFEGSYRSLFLKPVVLYREKHRSQHLIREYLQLLGCEQLDDQDLWPRMDLSADWIRNVLGKNFPLLPEEFICLAPGALYGPAKQWPVAHFAKLAGELSKMGKRVVIVGTEQDYENGELIRQGKEDILNLCGKSNLLQLFALLAKSSLLVSNDSGAMHIMAALQKPQIALFGSTSTTWTSPMNQKAKMITLNLPCAPCYSRTCPYGHYQCLEDIKPEKVLQELISQLT